MINFHINSCPTVSGWTMYQSGFLIALIQVESLRWRSFNPHHLGVFMDRLGVLSKFLPDSPKILGDGRNRLPN